MIRAWFMVGVTFFCVGGIANNDWHFADWMIAAAVWCIALALTFVVEYLAGPDAP